MTRQEIFNKIARHLLTQREKSEGELPTGTVNHLGVPCYGTSCLYRGEGGMKCAVGIFIPDDEYTPALEGKRVAELFGLVPSLKGLDRKVLEAGQFVHDELEVSEWQEGLVKAAENLELELAW